MTFRPADIQVVLQVSRSIERMQNLQQQYSRQQQEMLAAYMRKDLAEKERSTVALPQPEHTQLRAINEHQRKEKREQQRKKRKDRFNKRVGTNIDVLI